MSPVLNLLFSSWALYFFFTLITFFKTGCENFLSTITVTVMVERKYSHPVLKKVIRVRKNYNAHDENNKYKTGDKVSIIESKPFSKNKKFQVMENTK